MKSRADSSLSDKIYYWLALYMIKGIGNATFLLLLNRFSSPEKVFSAGINELLDAGIKKDLAYRIENKEFKIDPEEELKKIEKNGVRILTYQDKEYPQLLKNIDCPPVLLYVKGAVIPNNQLLISIVGSRNPSHYGLRIAESISFRLSKIGIGIISGIARGIDTAAHKGALKANGYTIAVLGTGIDVAYPIRNKDLFNKIIEKDGTIISEFPMGTPPEPKNFPIRNRIISGLGRGVLVVEATRKSGSLITASFALNQGREVFAIPGSIESLKSKGTHFLIKQGAKLVEDVDDIVEEFGIEIEKVEKDKVESDAFFDLRSEEKKIYDLLSEYPIHIDEIVRVTGMDTAEVLSSLLKMELKGIVAQIPGKMFIKRARK